MGIYATAFEEGLSLYLNKLEFLYPGVMLTKLD
jgi:hypothetical protein